MQVLADPIHTKVRGILFEIKCSPYRFQVLTANKRFSDLRGWRRRNNSYLSGYTRGRHFFGNLHQAARQCSRRRGATKIVANSGVNIVQFKDLCETLENQLIATCINVINQPNPN